MGLRINDVAPDFTTDSTAGKLSLHAWIGDNYAILFSHPKDFTPVCTTEFGAVARLAPEFAKRNTKVMGVSVDSVEEHEKWKRDIESFADAPPADWVPGEDVIVGLSLDDAQAAKKYGKLDIKLPYLRFAKAPR